VAGICGLKCMDIIQMEASMELGIPLGRFNHLGMVVKDLDKAIKHYESLGIGPFKMANQKYKSRTLLGRPVPPDVVLTKVATAQAGPLHIGLIQPIAEETHWMEFLKTKGEGVNHLGFFTDDYDQENAKLIEKGHKIIYECAYELPNGTTGRASYFDTDKVGGILIEPIEMR